MKLSKTLYLRFLATQNIIENGLIDCSKPEITSHQSTFKEIIHIRTLFTNDKQSIDLNLCARHHNATTWTVQNKY
jgi:hypothetical protein